MGALEVSHIERWVASTPDVLGEKLLVITQQFDAFDKTKERPDVLALDEEGKLVVIELKRDDGGKQDLQALRYAAFCSRFGIDDLVELYVEYRAKKGESISSEEALARLKDHVVEGGLEEIETDMTPRIILVAKSFQVEIATTCLWLREQFEMDISCVQLVPYVVEGKVLLASSVLVPLPEASDYTIQRDRKRRRAAGKKRVDWGRLVEVMAAIPRGHWMSYQDLAVAAGGSPAAALAVGQYLAKVEGLPEGVHRVLRVDGSVSPGWVGEIGGPAECRALLESEGLTFDDKGRADPARRWKPTASV
jgi:alkylated DNA nucleotide flippase Atl1